MAELEKLVQKQSELIARTGKQLVEYQVQDVKAKMRAEQPSAVDSGDFATNEDLVTLVQELQGQLDFLEDRSIKRMHNVRLKETLLPLVNRDGEAPADFPQTLEAFKKIDKSTLVSLCEFYELIVDEPPADVQQILQQDNLTPEDAQKLFGQGKSVAERVESLGKEEEEELYAELARYIGLAETSR